MLRHITIKMHILLYMDILWTRRLSNWIYLVRPVLTDIIWEKYKDQTLKIDGLDTQTTEVETLRGRRSVL